MSSNFDPKTTYSINPELLTAGAHNIPDLPQWRDQSHENIHGSSVGGLRTEVLDATITLHSSYDPAPESFGNPLAYDLNFGTENYEDAVDVHLQNLPDISSNPVDNLEIEAIKAFEAIRAIHARVYDVNSGHWKCLAGCKVKADRTYNHNRHQISIFTRERKNTRIFVCDHPTCQAAYTRKDHLQGHSKTHQLPFKCNACGNRFRTKGDLIKHWASFCPGST